MESPPRRTARFAPTARFASTDKFVSEAWAYTFVSPGPVPFLLSFGPPVAARAA